jgi:hypothetical protein
VQQPSPQSLQQPNKINSTGQNQEELMKNIDTALKGDVPSDIMSNKLLDEVLFFITPIISFLAFVLILIFGIIPNISGMSEKTQKIDSLKIEDTQLSSRINNLEKMKNDINSLESVIEKIDVIVPEGTTEIVKFSQRIRNAVGINMQSFANDLSEPKIIMNEIKIGETSLALTGSNANSGLKINQVPTEFTMTGGFKRFRQFFTNLYDGTDFFVVEKMQLSYNSSDRSWNGAISLVKYQFNKDTTFDAKTVYGSISEDTQPNAKVISFLKTKFIDNKLTE